MATAIGDDDHPVRRSAGEHDVCCSSMAIAVLTEYSSILAPLPLTLTPYSPARRIEAVAKQCLTLQAARTSDGRRRPGGAARRQWCAPLL